MLIFFNMLGMAMLGVGLLLFVSLDGLLMRSGAAAIGAMLLVLMDLGWRGWHFVKAREEYDPEWDAMTFVSPRKGGSLLFVPIWIIGIVTFIIATSIVVRALL